MVDDKVDLMPYTECLYRHGLYETLNILGQSSTIKWSDQAKIIAPNWWNIGTNVMVFKSGIVIPLKLKK